MSSDFLRPGTTVRYDGLDAGPEYGIVIHCWESDEIGGHDCYVAFFGSGFPTGQPSQKPYVFRYAAASLIAIES